MIEKNDCGNCTNQMTGFDGGFCGLPFTCECQIYGETENRKNCTEYEKKLTKSDLVMRITELERENEQLQKELDDFKPVIFQDVRKGTVILYSKGDDDDG